MIQRVGIVVGLALVGMTSWITNLARSSVLAGALPSLSESLNGLMGFGPVMLFFGFIILFLSLTRRVIISLVFSLILTVVLTVLLWS